MENDWQPETPGPFKWIAVLLADLAGVALVAMMLITVYDIIARTLGFGSVEAVVELTTMGVVIVASFALAITTIRCGHVIIDVFTSQNRKSTNRAIDAIWLLIMGVFLFAIAYYALQEGLVLHSYGTTTEVLEWSVLAHYFPPVIGWSLAGFICLWIGIVVFLRNR